MTVEEAGALGAAKRKQIEREPILAKARLLAGKPDPRLYPPLILTKGDML